MGISSKLETVLSAAAPDHPILVRIRATMREDYIAALSNLGPIIQRPTLVDKDLTRAQEQGMHDLITYLDRERIPYAPSAQFFRTLVAHATPAQIRAIASRDDVEAVCAQTTAKERYRPLRVT